MALTESPMLGSHLSEPPSLLDAFCTQRGKRRHIPRRDAFIDPLLIATVFATGPQTHHHAGHALYSPDIAKYSPGNSTQHKPCPYVSRQAPRSSRLQNHETTQDEEPAPLTSRPHPAAPVLIPETLVHPFAEQSRAPTTVTVTCMARTRIPTVHGTVFLHLYHNNRDNKEHLAIVIDPAQLSNDGQYSAPPIRSHSLDSVWTESETAEERLIRGAYVGTLTHESRQPSQPPTNGIALAPHVPAPLVRIHSECFTGETIGSMRCDCGEQLDEAIRVISQPVPVASSRSIPGRGVIVYMRQEGRGIGLLSKIRAYNLQDLGHDTVSANLKLGYKADERGYELAVAILRDLGLGSEQGEGVRLLTNNPDKVAALEREGLRVVERVPMVPRSWRYRPIKENSQRLLGVTTVGGGVVGGEDLDKYLRTKVLRMGHMLPLHSPDHSLAN
ncbi:cyclohydrolase [Pisolithus orientalis]|uniref:cyclohydrolase n=1 Tax=Pisolithus orientalis TaxID=936130 RepID=UPI0022259B1C|nr:cyclohydrolase [Pisolithus orientalis]KAI6035046.1 cyclohydrolase [Pisolithus orientalis]